MANFWKQIESRTHLPPRLPEELGRPGLKEYKSHGSTKRRSMTGYEAAEQAAARADRAKSAQADNLPDPSLAPRSPITPPLI